MAVAVFNSGAYLTAAQLNTMITYMTCLHARKPADTSRNTTVARTADPDLVVALAANTTYKIELIAIATSAANAAGDMSLELQFPANCEVSLIGHTLVDTIASGNSADLQAGSVAQDTSSPAGPFTIACTTLPTGTLITGTVTTGVTAGNLTVAWAQFASNANNTTLKGGSSITAVPVG